VKAQRDYRDFLNDIVAACRSVISFTDGMDLGAYIADEKTRFAVMRGYEIIGEAVRHIPDGVKAENPQIPWRLMADMRNRIIHGYFGIDDTVLFASIEADLKPLLPALRLLARQHGVGGEDTSE
jgi:uncharacterized protein with HEPN domain